MARLVEVISSLDDIPVGEAADVTPTIFARKPWTPASPCLVLAEEAVNGRARSAPDYAYLLEVDLARDVLASGLTGALASHRAQMRPIVQ